MPHAPTALSSRSTQPARGPKKLSTKGTLYSLAFSLSFPLSRVKARATQRKIKRIKERKLAREARKARMSHNFGKGSRERERERERERLSLVPGGLLRKRRVSHFSLSPPPPPAVLYDVKPRMCLLVQIRRRARLVYGDVSAPLLYGALARAVIRLTRGVGGGTRISLHLACHTRRALLRKV